MCQLTCHVKHSQAEQPRTTMQFRPEEFKWVAQGIYVSKGLHPFHAAFPVVRSLKHRSAANVVVLSELILLSGSSIERRYPRWRDIEEFCQICIGSVAILANATRRPNAQAFPSNTESVQWLMLLYLRREERSFLKR